MSKYEPLLGDLKSRILSSENILIFLPSQVTTDKFAAGLSLFLALEQTGKQINIISEGTVLVSHSNLYGVGKVKNQVPQVAGGNLTITLEGVVAPDGTVPSLDKLDWFPEGQNLNLVFHVLPGQKFEPKSITPKFADNSKSLIFVTGAGSLNELGSVYSANSGMFQGAYVVNIDNNSANSKFGSVNVVDSTPSISEIVMALLSDLGLIVNSDIASNILSGVYFATNNMTTNVAPETFMVVGQAMQLGGIVPTQTQPFDSAQGVPPVQESQSQPAIPSFSQTFAPQQTHVSQSIAQPVAPSPLASNPFIPPIADSFTFSGNTSIPAQPITQPVTEPAPVTGVPLSQPMSAPTFEQAPAPFNSPQAQQPMDEATQPSADWLTPKVYKGTSLG